ncbi:MAG TPA: nitroreductase family protein [Acidimicrobiales bacterium]|nr:nitroreductase family protein [Acidimicrobiales bacterium]
MADPTATDRAVSLLEGIATTRSIRRFRPDPVTDDELAQLLFAATRAPTGSNRQPFRFVVLRDGPAAVQAKALLGRAFRAGWAAKRRSDGYDGGGGPGPAGDSGGGGAPNSPKARMAAAMQHFVDNFESIPVVILPCLVRYRAPTPTEGGSLYPACQNLLLAARALGLGGTITMWHALVEDELRQLLGIPDGVLIGATIPIGRPVGNHGPVRRRPVRELVYDDVWGQEATWAVEPEGTRHTSAGPPVRSGQR